jgi:hypothetical protein
MKRKRSINTAEELVKAVRYRPKRYNDASMQLKRDQALLLRCVEQNYKVLEFALKKFLHDADLMRKVFLKVGRASVKFYGKSVFKNRDLAVVMVRRHGYWLRRFSPLVQRERAMILLAVQTFGGYLRFADKTAREDREIVTAAVKQCGVSLSYAPKFSNDRDMVLLALKSTPHYYKFIKESFQLDREIALTAFCQPPNGLTVKDLDPRFQDDPSFLEHAVTANPRLYITVNECLQHNFSVSLAAVKSCADVIQYVPQRLKNDSAFGLAVAHHQVAALIHVTNRVRQESRVCVAAYFSLQREQNNLTKFERLHQTEKVSEINRLRDENRTYLRSMSVTKLMKQTLNERWVLSDYFPHPRYRFTFERFTLQMVQFIGKKNRLDANCANGVFQFLNVFSLMRLLRAFERATHFNAIFPRHSSMIRFVKRRKDTASSTDNGKSTGLSL